MKVIARTIGAMGLFYLATFGDSDVALFIALFAMLLYHETTFWWVRLLATKGKIEHVDLDLRSGRDGRRVVVRETVVKH